MNTARLRDAHDKNGEIKMRLMMINLLTVGLMLFSAASASAINIFLNPPTPTGPLNPGDQFSIDLILDTEGETEITSVFVSVQVDPTVLSFVGGTSPGQILFNFGTFSGIGRVSEPFTLASDPDGLVRAASFAALSPSGQAESAQLLATLTFEAVGAGTSAISGLIAQGDDVTVSGASVAGSVTFGPGQTMEVVPEPGTALLMGLGLAGLTAAGRRKA